MAGSLEGWREIPPRGAGGVIAQNSTGRQSAHRLRHSLACTELRQRVVINRGTHQTAIPQSRIKSNRNISRPVRPSKRRRASYRGYPRHQHRLERDTPLAVACEGVCE